MNAFLHRLISLNFPLHFRVQSRKSDIRLAWNISGIHSIRISDITLLNIRSHQLNTPSIGCHKRFKFEEFRVPIWYWRLIFQDFIDWLVTFLNTSITLNSNNCNFYKLLNIKCCDELNCAEKVCCPLKCVNCV